MNRLSNPILKYAWGSRTAIATIQGRPAPSAHPEAELWLGAHPAAPSRLGPVSLGEAIEADPVGLLGADVLGRFGVRLPYLLKLLAAAEPLSLQAHPDADQAATGFAAEEAAGLARDDPVRSYVDPYHKPELLVAVDNFEALCGFRAPEVSASRLESLDVPALAPVIAALRAGSTADRLRGAVEWLMSSPADQRPQLVAAVARAGGLPAELARRYPDDTGVVLALLLNHVRLQPGEAVWMPAGNLHAYLCGVGVEIMAASDNVLRGGLSPKHLDVPGLLQILRYDVLDDPVRRPVSLGPGLCTWPVPAVEFSLCRADLTEAAEQGYGHVGLPGGGPRIVLCLDGRAALRAESCAVELSAGEAAFVPATDGAVRASGTAILFQAHTPD
ncbi:MAG: mannose-6-phosphate isomerase, class I [Micromonosporaceae bacterium]